MDEKEVRTIQLSQLSTVWCCIQVSTSSCWQARLPGDPSQQMLPFLRGNTCCVLRRAKKRPALPPDISIIDGAPTVVMGDLGGTRVTGCFEVSKIW